MAKLKLNISKDFFNEVDLALLDNKESSTVLMSGGGSGKSHLVNENYITNSNHLPHY
jgi:hypothetical protein